MSLRSRLTASGIEQIENGSPESTDMSASVRDEIERNIHYLLVEELGPRLEATTESDVGLRQQIERKLNELLAKETAPLSAADRREIAGNVLDNILGYGPIQSLIDDPTITEVMVNNPDSIYIERGGRIHETQRRFLDERHLLRIIDKIVSQVGRRIDEASPMVDARLPDGSRVNAIIAPLAVNGPMLTIRKFSREPFTIEDLIGFGTMSESLAEFLEACVRGRLNVLISGGTGTGKTTLLNVVSQYVPGDERIITVEDAAELQLHQEHVLRLESRPPNIEGTGQVTIRDLVRNTLRMRPDRIIVGEVRGGEALDMLQAMNTGHDGSLSTVHANSPRDALSRIETMVLMAGYDLPVRAIREQAASAFDLLVHLARLRDGSRRVVKVAEVEGMEGDTIVLQDIFYFDYSMGVDEAGKHLGHLKSTGLRPKFTRRLEDMGIALPANLFEYQAPARR
ncbi:CpaF family protein [Anaerosoma tenue]|uniref:CpaF family protein n=1 Tax=Anaerosoma tenue TaxID=2933588 RepID=UPI0022608E23|nr:CpaF family protein [Anaerosoma tenue]MCK8114730.1 CpaF family protein [Anaerosoma tenue]